MNHDENKKFNIQSVIASDNYSLKKGSGRDVADFLTDDFGGEWENIAKLLAHLKGDWFRALVNDDIRIRLQFFATYIILGLVSLGMTILNAYTEWRVLGYVTFTFFMLSMLNCALCMISEKMEKLAQILFGIEIVGLFTIFAIVGHPEGFSILWSLILPTCGMLLFRAKYGSIVALSQWVILILLFWTTLGRSILMYDYTQSFLQRFPLLYIACFFVGYFFELVRFRTHEELIAAREQFEYLYRHDALTGLYNRYGLNAKITNAKNNGKNPGKAFAIADLDHFKKTNDTYGHLVGDEVLKTSAGIIKEVVGEDGFVCRWGGEEFSIVFLDETKAEETCKKINSAVAAHEYHSNGVTFNNTISIGLVLGDGGELPQSSPVITQADENLYISKTTGRNKVTTTVMRDGDTPEPGADTQQAS